MYICRDKEIQEFREQIWRIKDQTKSSCFHGSVFVEDRPKKHFQGFENLKKEDVSAFCGFGDIP